MKSSEGFLLFPLVVIGISSVLVVELFRTTRKWRSALLWIYSVLSNADYSGDHTNVSFSIECRKRPGAHYYW